jgi:hypothetical protein
MAPMKDLVASVALLASTPALANVQHSDENSFTIQQSIVLLDHLESARAAFLHLENWWSDSIGPFRRNPWCKNAQRGQLPCVRLATPQKSNELVLSGGFSPLNFGTSPARMVARFYT